MLSSFQTNLIEEKLNYSFKNKALLLQAFTRKSFASENPDYHDNEVLEFMGDKILSYMLAKQFSSEFGFLQSDQKKSFSQYVSMEDEGILTARLSELIKNTSLTNKMQESGLLQYVIKSQTDLMSGKSEGDIFEAILGAIAIDSSWNEEVLQNTINLILNPKETYTHTEYESRDFVKKLENFCKEQNIFLSDIRINKTETDFISKLMIKKDGVYKKFKQRAKSQEGAMQAIARHAYIYIKIYWLHTAVEEWIINPMSQLQEFKLSGEIENYLFEHTISSENKIICSCTIPVNGKVLQSVSDSFPNLKQARIDASRKVLPSLVKEIKKKQLKGQGILKIISELYI